MIFQLARDLKTLCEEVFAHTVFRDPGAADEQHLSPRVYIGALPPKRNDSDADRDFPFIVVRVLEGTDGDDASEVVAELYCGAYTAEADSPEAAGANDIQNMIDLLRRRLLTDRIVAQRWRISLPMQWSLGEGTEHRQPHPYYVGALRVTFDYVPAGILPTTDDALRIFGDGIT